MTEDDDLRAHLRKETDHLQPDIANLVRGGTSRGRSKRRRRMVGTSAATVVAVAAVAAGAGLLSSGGLRPSGSDAADGGSPDVISSSPATHGTTHRPLQSATGISDRLAALLPGDDDGGATSVGAASVGVAGSSGTPGDAGTLHDLSSSMGFRHGFVTIDVSDVATTNTVTAVPATGPDGAPDSPSSASASPAPLNEEARTGFGDPETECRTAASQATTVTEPCHQVDNGDWAYSSMGMESSEYLIGYPADTTSDVPPLVPGASVSPGFAGSGSDPTELPESTGPQPAVATTTLFTTDHWRVTAWATSPESDSDTPVLGADDLQAMAQDGGWFLAPGETPVPDADATTGPTTCDPCAAPPTSVPGTAVPVTDRAPVVVEDLPGVFSSLIPGTITHIHATDSSSVHPATTFQWNGVDVKISVDRAASVLEGGSSSGGGSAGGSGSSTRGGHTLGASNVTVDGWEVSITAFGLPSDTTLSDTMLDHAVSSDDWFTS